MDSALKRDLLTEELCSLTGRSLMSASKPQQIETMKKVKDGNMVQKVCGEETAVSISFLVASFYLLHKSTGVQTNFRLL